MRREGDQYQVIHNKHCCVFWVPALSSGLEEPLLNIFSCCRCREQEHWWVWQSHDGTRRKTDTLELEVCPLCRLAGLVHWIHFMWTNQSCLQSGSRLEQLMSGCGPLTKQQLKYCSNWKHAFTPSPIEGSRCVGCTRILTEHWTRRPKLNHNQSLSEIVSANKHRNDVCPSTVAAGLRHIVRLSCLTNSGWVQEPGCLLLTACNLFKSTQISCKPESHWKADSWGRSNINNSLNAVKLPGMVS